MTEQTKRTTIAKLTQVGRYALGVEWGDGHDSILPYRDLRAHCPCEECVGAPTPSPSASDVADLQRLGEGTLFFRWADGHETLLVADDLRELCRCAYCVGEPKYPITGR